MSAFAAGDLVDLVQEYNAGIFHAINCRAGDLIHVDQALLFFLNQILKGLIDLHLPFLASLTEDVRQHVLDVDVHLFDALVGNDLERGETSLTNVQLYHALVELALAKLLAELLPSPALRFADLGSGAIQGNAAARRFPWSWWREQQIQEALFRVQFGFIGDILKFFLANHVNRDLDEVPDQGLYVAPHVTDFGELRSFHFQKRRVSEFCQTAGNLRFPNPCWADHDDVLGDDFFGKFGSQLLAARTIP